MTAKERILFQPYIAGRHAGVVPGQAVLCRSIDDAHWRAEKAMAGGRVVGVHIVRVHDDAAAGEYGEPEYPAAFGTVPTVTEGGGAV
jgi:hypothetical protein